uniref:HAT C-terminal dimerisation domain-containing protein n=1 Tax=Solanum lycopersicum TaxID=4081 RepID=A0A3Q7H7X3_SOLLC
MQKIECDKMLSLDVPTRCNSTYLMLDTAEKFEKAFEMFDLYDDKSIAGSIKYEDWANVRNVTMFLEKFYELTSKVSGSQYVTCNVHFEDICEVDAYLKLCIASDDLYLSKMASGMKEKFKKYWGTPEKMNKMILLLIFSLEELLGEETENVVNTKVEAYLRDLFAIYVNQEPESEDFDILSWWKVNFPRFPVLSQLAQDVLAIPMSSMASECALSTGGLILDPFRSSLTPKCVQCLICVQDWLRQETKPICVEENLVFKVLSLVSLSSFN